MPFNVNEFLSSMSKRNGPMSASRFEVTIVPGPGNQILQSAVSITENRFINFSAFTATIPGITFDNDYILQRGYGRINEIPVRPTMGDCDVSFYLDENIDVYRYLYSWMNSVINMKGDLSSGGENFLARYQEVYYPVTYYATVQISCFSQTENRILDVYLKEAFPLELSGVNLDWGNTDSVATASLSLGYRHVEIYRGGTDDDLVPRG